VPGDGVGDDLAVAVQHQARTAEFRIDKIGLPPIGWLTNPSIALPALAFMSLWGVGHTVVIYLAGLQDVPKELYEAAEIDGATGCGDCGTSRSR
jgi:ABC-type sugar transport system permease subunit